MRMDDPQPPDPQDPGRLLRPFVLTGGRARPVHGDELEIEALVATTGLGETAGPTVPEHWSINRLCHQPQSIAELAAHMKVPLGVIRVLVADMAQQGLVQLYRPVRPGPVPNVPLLERVLDGLRRI